MLDRMHENHDGDGGWAMQVATRSASPSACRPPRAMSRSDHIAHARARAPSRAILRQRRTRKAVGAYDAIDIPSERKSRAKRVDPPPPRARIRHALPSGTHTPYHTSPDKLLDSRTGIVLGGGSRPSRTRGTIRTLICNISPATAPAFSRLPHMRSHCSS